MIEFFAGDPIGYGVTDEDYINEILCDSVLEEGGTFREDETGLWAHFPLDPEPVQLRKRMAQWP